MFRLYPLIVLALCASCAPSAVFDGLDGAAPGPDATPRDVGPARPKDTGTTRSDSGWSDVRASDAPSGDGGAAAVDSGGAADAGAGDVGSLERCGDGELDSGELCDDGNRDDTDACRNDCRPARCGDGVVWAGHEVCDDGNRNNFDECLNDCRPARCGDGFRHPQREACDDGNTRQDDGCLNDCALARCGDGLVWRGEEDCDDGNADNTDACTSDCTQARCGDGYVHAEREECDDQNLDNTDACLSNCQGARCGDGEVWAGQEPCDDGNADDSDACLTGCVSATCGDGHVWAGQEPCDDGDADNTDGCLTGCVLPTCGDGHVWAGQEPCDDGDADDTDGCLTGCALPTCGDGHIWAGHEACDDGDADQTDGCLSDCREASCGDGHVWAGHEPCDDGNAVQTDACLTGCVLPTCGDGHAWAGHEPCDDGNALQTDACLNDCRAASCGDGFVQNGAEACDDGGQNGVGACSLVCAARYVCDDLPMACPALGADAPNNPDHTMASTEGCRFALDAPSTAAWTEGEAVAQRLIGDFGGGRTLAQVSADTNRVMTNSLSWDTRNRMRNHDYVGHTWNSGDDDVSYWMPQGITGSEDGDPAEERAPRRLMMVSWYNKTDSRPTKGARLSIVDMDQNPPEYRHVMLVEPYRQGGAVNYRATENDDDDANALHVGGIVWYGPYLYVADTHVGMRVFDLTRMLRVDVTDTSVIGVSGGQTHAAGYRYILPQIAVYSRSRTVDQNGYASCHVKFSAIGLDRTTTPHTILSSEYYTPGRSGRLVTWTLDADTHRLDARAGLAGGPQVVRGQSAAVSGENRMQGALRANGITYISSSSQYGNKGRLYRNRTNDGESSRTAYPYGVEDLYFERDRNLIWTATEHPGQRELVGIPIPGR